MFLDHADAVLKPYEFKMEEIEGFRYRCRVSIFDDVRSVKTQNVAKQEEHLSVLFVMLVFIRIHNEMGFKMGISLF